jgi:hypothetical protein
MQGTTQLKEMRCAGDIRNKIIKTEIYYSVRVLSTWKGKTMYQMNKQSLLG